MKVYLFKRCFLACNTQSIVLCLKSNNLLLYNQQFNELLCSKQHVNCINQKENEATKGFCPLKSFIYLHSQNGELPEWSNGADSKSVDRRLAVRGFESLALRENLRNPPHERGSGVSLKKTRQKRDKSFFTFLAFVL